MITQIPFDDSQEFWNRVYKENGFFVPFLTWDWHNAWRRRFLESGKDLTLKYNDTVIIPLIFDGDSVKFSGGEEIADYLDIIGANDQKLSAWNETLPFLRKFGIKSITLRNVPHDSATRTFFETNGADVVFEDTTPLIRLPNTWETYLTSLSKKYRHELERKIRKFQREHIDAVVSESMNPSADIDILLRLMEKDEAKRTFLTDKMKAFFTSIPNYFPDSVSFFTVQTGDKPIAATLSFSLNNTYYLYNSGFDKDCCNIAGFYLKAMTVKHAIEAGFTVYNFLQGNERYKYELGGEDFYVFKISSAL